MKFLLYSLLGVLVLALAALVVGMNLQPAWRLERSAVMDAPPGPVFAYVSVLSNWSEWTVWNTQEHPSVKYTPSGPDWGIGATLSWDNKGRNGQIEVAEYVPGDYMEYELVMDKDAASSRGSFRIEPASGGGSRLTWAVWGRSGTGVLSKLRMLAYRPFIVRDLNGGLSNLQKRFHVEPGVHDEQPATQAGPAPDLPAEETPALPDSLPKDSDHGEQDPQD